ncbi:MAG: hypothetical protein AUK47_02055 [Deltaproteobacteria bacterium CG2_30_63_29]|nr:MAG: hypothetical protein AUK47_02055 [Deltaproteobacteria bacterium CG2_30_63_29]PJB45468.1 MAG: hypothetical protein CO108_07300 [Deltaproteobacteria bacterium CG_4_9_14_3_um_filter_63_12]
MNQRLKTERALSTLILVLLLARLVGACDDTSNPRSSLPDAQSDATADLGTSDGVINDVTDQDAGHATDVSTELDTVADQELPPRVCPPAPSEVAGLNVQGSGRWLRVYDFPSGSGLTSRNITIYLPEGYDSTNQYYPVLYMHDGQNLFDASEAGFGVEWQVDETIDDLTRRGKLNPWIVVGIDNTDARMDEYTPIPDADYGGGRADEYIALIEQRIKPFIDSRFRTLCDPANSAILGSSLGGLIDLYIVMKHPGTFERVGCVSPSLWWNNQSVLRDYEATSAGVPMRLWLDGGSEEGAGTDEGDTTVIADARRARDRALELGGRFGENVGFLADEGAAHNEAAWARRLPSILSFLLGEEQASSRTPNASHVVVYDSQVDIGESTRAELELTHGETRLTWPYGLSSPSLSSADKVTVTSPGVLRGASYGTTILTLSSAGTSASELLEVSNTPNWITMRFEVEVPSADAVWISGDVQELGAWDGAGLQLQPLGNDRWGAELTLPAGLTLLYKYTRGTWPTVEKDANGDELSNRVQNVDRPRIVSDRVVRWADQ